MNILEVCNPVLVVGVLTESFSEMAPDAYHQTLRNTLDKAEKFLRSDDTTFSTSLDLQEGTEYADHIRTFMRQVNQLKDAPQRQELSSMYLAQVIAWWQVLSAFRTLHGKPSLDEVVK